MRASVRADVRLQASDLGAAASVILRIRGSRIMIRESRIKDRGSRGVSRINTPVHYVINTEIELGPSEENLGSSSAPYRQEPLTIKLLK